MGEPNQHGRRDSATRSRAFYRRLGPAGLAIRTKPDWDAQIVLAVRRRLPASGRVLDCGCGYGRIAIPLAETGCRVTGIDVSPNLLRAARREAAQRGVAVRFDLGAMTALPYEDSSFEAVVCLWSAFYELLEVEEQVSALREMRRVLVPGGIGMIEGPTFTDATDDEIASGRRRGPGHRIRVENVAGLRMEQFAHDVSSLLRAALAAQIDDPKVLIEDWAGRDRQLLIFRH